MNDPFSNYSEAYEVVKTAIVVHKSRFIKIEVLRNLAPPGEFSVRASEEKSLKLKPTDTEEHRVWTYMNGFPWVNRDTLDGALAQALAFLRER